jgi:anthraniloyl-CoA monooxygenase
VDYLQRLFEEELRGHPLLTNKSEWINFRTVKNEHWFAKNLVLLGDAARTAHFSIGSGTKLAMEDAICLARCLAEEKEPLEAYEAERKWYSERLQQMAEESRRWFETVKSRRHLEPEQFAYSMMTRNKRLGHDQLRLRDEAYIDRVERWFAGGAPPRPPMFTPFSLRSLKLENRIVCSPMCMYSAEDGTVSDWHLVHLGSRAVGGAGLVIAEMTDVSRDGRISTGCAGMYKPEHAGAWRRVTEFVHQWTRSKIGLQLGHAGRKGATKLMWDGHEQPLDKGAWPVLSASAIPYRRHGQVPKAMDRADLERVKADYVRAARMAEEAGFDLIEIHMAHGYLLASFLSPLSNRRSDEYGGGIGGRMRYPLEVFRAVREAWPEAKPISVRVSAIDWKDGGQTIEETIEFCAALKEAGCDIVDVSTGHTDEDEKPDLARCYQVPFAERIRLGAGTPTISVGAISRHGEINAILASGCADLVALARPHLFDPNFTLRAAAEQGCHDQPWPKQYGPAKPPPREKLPWLERERRRKS